MSTSTDLRAERGCARDRLIVGAGRGAIAEEHALSGNRYAEPHALAEGTDGAERAVCANKGSAASGPAMAASAVQQSSVVSAKIETQSSERQAGTTPAVEMSPRLGLRPTMLLSPAGTRPDPCGVGAERERHEPRRDRDRRARARSARGSEPD
jgi:hypothetical protein